MAFFGVDNLDVDEAVNQTLYIIENNGSEINGPQGPQGPQGNFTELNTFSVLFNEPGSDTYTIPGNKKNVYQIQPKIIGGGGGGGYGITGAAGGGGGGGASYDTNLFNAIINYGILNQPFKVLGGTKINYKVGRGGKGAIFEERDAEEGEESSINYEVINNNDDLSLLLLPIKCPGGNPGQNGQKGGVGGAGGAGGAVLLPNLLSNEGPRGEFYDNNIILNPGKNTILNFSPTGSFLSNNGIIATGPNLYIKKDPLKAQSIINLSGRFNNSSPSGSVLFQYFIDNQKEETYSLPLKNNVDVGKGTNFDFNEILAFNQYENLSIKLSLTGTSQSFTGYIDCNINSPLISCSFKTTPTGLPNSKVFTPISFGNPTGFLVGMTGSKGFKTIEFEEDSIINISTDCYVESSKTGYYQMEFLLGGTGVYKSNIISSGEEDFNTRINVKKGDILSVNFRQVPTGTISIQKMSGYFNYDITSVPIKLENGITGFAGTLNFNLSAGGGGGGGTFLGGKGGNGLTIPILQEFLDGNPDILENILNLTPANISDFIESGNLILQGGGVNFSIIDLIQLVLFQGGFPGNNNFINFIKYLANTLNLSSPISFNGGNGGGIIDAGAGGIGNENFVGGGGGGGFGGGEGGNYKKKTGNSTITYGSGGGGGSSDNGNGGDGANGSISLLITRIQ